MLIDTISLSWGRSLLWIRRESSLVLLFGLLLWVWWKSSLGLLFGLLLWEHRELGLGLLSRFILLVLLLELVDILFSLLFELIDVLFRLLKLLLELVVFRLLLLDSSKSLLVLNFILLSKLFNFWSQNSLSLLLDFLI